MLGNPPKIKRLTKPNDMDRLTTTMNGLTINVLVSRPLPGSVSTVYNPGLTFLNMRSASECVRMGVPSPK